MTAEAQTLDTRPRERQAAREYKYSRIMTAGRVRSVILLIEKAITLIPSIDTENPTDTQPELVQCMNIIAQLEMALNFKNGKAVQDLFRVYELVYNGLQAHTEESLKVARYLLGHLRETIRMRFRR